MNIYWYKLIENTGVEGPGRRFCIWFQGCKIHCPGCMLPETWPFQKNQKMSCRQLVRKILDTPEIEGITILGGEPFNQPKALLSIVRQIRKKSKLSIMLFSGYTSAYLEQHCPQFQAILSYTDLFIEGPYRKEQVVSFHPWIGSSNQIIHFLTSRYSPRDIPAQKIELRITPQGEVYLNGMISHEKLEALYQILS